MERTHDRATLPEASPSRQARNYNEQEVIGRFTGKGLAGFVQKPYRVSDLLPVIRRVLGEE